MGSKLHQEMNFYKGIPNVCYFDNMVGILKEVTNKRKTCKCIPSGRKNRLYIRFLCDLGLLTQEFKKDGSGRANFRINKKALKFMKDYQRLRSLMI